MNFQPWLVWRDPTRRQGEPRRKVSFRKSEEPGSPWRVTPTHNPRLTELEIPYSDNSVSRRDRMKIRDIQQQLAARGYTPGAIDGIWGRHTIAAVRAFQTTHGLTPDGIVGPVTLAALFQGAAGAGAAAQPAAQANLNDPSRVWFQEARRLMGTKEAPGAGNNPEILDWATELGLKKSYTNDEIPWCGLFVGHCVSSTLDREATPASLLSARAWERFGVKTRPTPGAVMVFWRKTRASGLGHVGFYAGEDAGAYRILGGNQSNSVSLAWVARDRFVDARWPATVPPRIGGPVQVARTETLSWNEA